MSVNRIMSAPKPPPSPDAPPASSGESALAADAMDLPSPCVGICDINPENDLCRGCLRSRSEISAWRGLSRPEKRALLETLHRRRMGQSEWGRGAISADRARSWAARWAPQGDPSGEEGPS